MAGTTYYLTETNVGCCLGYYQHDTSAAAAFAFKTVGDLHGITDVMYVYCTACQMEGRREGGGGGMFCTYPGLAFSY